MSVTAGQGPEGSFVVNVNVTVPEVAVGVRALDSVHEFQYV